MTRHLAPLMLLAGLFLMACQSHSSFVVVRDGRFCIGGQPYNYIGANLWYGAILGSEGQGGNRQQLCRELDRLCELGVKNLRVLVGGEGCTPTLSGINFWAWGGAVTSHRPPAGKKTQVTQLNLTSAALRGLLPAL